MNVSLTTHLNMIGTALAVGKRYTSVWQDTSPLFGSDLARIEEGYNALVTKAALAETKAPGAADAKAVAERRVEEQAFMLAQSLAYRFTRLGRGDDLAKVDAPKTAFVRLRDQNLVTRATEIASLAQAEVGQTNADAHGITADRVTALHAAIAAFRDVIALPRDTRISYNTLLKELETDAAHLSEELRLMDKLVVQFFDTDEERRFNAEWFAARALVQTGGGPRTPDPVPPATAPTAPAPTASS